MSKLYCQNVGGNPGTNNANLAVKECDACEKLLCKYCGYIENGADYCNDCYRNLKVKDLITGNRKK